jgi:hypothetical protein
LDECNLQVIKTQDYSSVPYTRRDKSKVKRMVESTNKRGKTFNFRY